MEDASSSSSSFKHDDDNSTTAAAVDSHKVRVMLDACSKNDMSTITTLVDENCWYACQQDDTTGLSPLMVAAQVGNVDLCRYLLDCGAPWNAVDRNGQCAGNYATTADHWDVVDLLVTEGTRAELILGASIRLQRDDEVTRRKNDNNNNDSSNTIDCDHVETHNNNDDDSSPRPIVEHEPSTKPDYLRQRLVYDTTGRALLDDDGDAVMMEWERPLMEAHASILMNDDDGTTTAGDVDTADAHSDTSEQQQGKSVLNIGFGMGIVDTAIQKYHPSTHYIIEAHPDVYRQMLESKWNEMPNVRICFGRWQDVLPRLVRDENLQVDAIFYDTYGEHFLDMEDFHRLLPRVLRKPNGTYSFFNGLTPDNIFFHGVACQCVKLQLGRFGLDTEFLPCEIQVKDTEWEGIRRKYWHGRDTYYLPKVTWKKKPDAIAAPAPPATSMITTTQSDCSSTNVEMKDEFVATTTTTNDNGSDKKDGASPKHENKDAKRQKL